MSRQQFYKTFNAFVRKPETLDLIANDVNSVIEGDASDLQQRRVECHLPWLAQLKVGDTRNIHIGDTRHVLTVHRGGFVAIRGK